MPAADHRDGVASPVARLAEEMPGWYEGTLDFKRVVLIPATGKHEYRDTHFVANVKATSGLDSIIESWSICATVSILVVSSHQPRERISITVISVCGNNKEVNL